MLKKVKKSILATLILSILLLPQPVIGEIYISLDAEGSDFSVKSTYLWDIYDNGYTWAMGSGEGYKNGTVKPWRTTKWARSGNYSLALEIKPPITWDDSQRLTYQTPRYNIYTGSSRKRYFGFSILRDDLFPEDIWEWFVEFQTTSSPMMRMRNDTNPETFTIRWEWGDRTDGKNTRYVDSVSDIPWPKNKWMDFIIYLVANPEGNAEIKVWLNGIVVVDKSGSNVKIGYKNDPRQYGKWEFQIYTKPRDKTRRIYFDNVRLASTKNEADPSKWGTIGNNNPPSVFTVDVRVAGISDDAEESASGAVSVTSSDLELVNDGSDKTVGIRFTGVDIPAGATIADAYIQFQVDETGSQATSLTIEGEATDDAQTFATVNSDISARGKTIASVGWSPVAWTSVGAAGSDQQTPDISSIIEEIVNLPGWTSGNSLVVIITGTGKRVAESYNGDPAGAPLLHVEYTTGPPVNRAPSVDAGSDQTITLPEDRAFLDVTVADDGLPDPPGYVAATWSQVSGPVGVVFDNVNDEDTWATFPGPGTYVLQLECDDGELTASDGITIMVYSEPTSITTHPADLVVTEGEAAAFSVEATGTAPLYYQWQRWDGTDWEDIVGATDSSYLISATIWPDDNGEMLRCFVWNDVDVSGVTSNAAVLTVRELTAGYFESYSAGSHPAGWLDTGANSSMVEDDSLFEVFAVSSDMVFGTNSTQSNIHSHYTDTSYDARLGFEYSGRMRMSAAASGLGVTFLSQYPSSDRYYRLRRYGSNSFHLSPHGTTVAGSTSTNVSPVANTWYLFKIEVQDTGIRTEIRASVWAEGMAEPENWQIDAYDDSATRLTSGNIGVWSYTSGIKYWDDLAVSPLF